MKRLVLIVAVLVTMTWSAIGYCASDCLKYEPSESVVSGVIKSEVFPGPPEYEGIQKGDKPETYWILHLDAPICVDQTDPKNDIDVPESNVLSLQLVITDYDKYRSLLGKHVKVKGRLMHQITIHHRTIVLIIVEEISERPNQAL
jgi:hypothetical protein